MVNSEHHSTAAGLRCILEFPVVSQVHSITELSLVQKETMFGEWESCQSSHDEEPFSTARSIQLWCYLGMDVPSLEPIADDTYILGVQGTYKLVSSPAVSKRSGGSYSDVAIQDSGWQSDPKCGASLFHGTPRNGTEHSPISRNSTERNSHTQTISSLVPSPPTL